MNKIQAFSLLVVTLLLLFSQESSGAADNRIQILRTAIEDIRALNESIHIKRNTPLYRMPQDVPENCALNALACFVDILDRIQKTSLHRSKHIRENKLIGDINTNIQSYLEKTVHPNVKPKELCYQCNFIRRLNNIQICLDDLLNLLQRATSQL